MIKKAIKMLRYPFNKYGFYDYITYPIKQIIWRQQIFKNIDICPWDLVNIYETVFARFKRFCKGQMSYYDCHKNKYLKNACCDIFINQYCRETHNPFGYTQEKWNDLMHDNQEAYRRLHEIQEYVLYTRDINQEKLEYIRELYHKSYTCKWVNSFLGKDLTEFTTTEDFHLEVNFWFEQGELMYEYKKVDHKTDFNPLDIEDVLTKLDRQYAKEIIEYSGYIWD